MGKFEIRNWSIYVGKSIVYTIRRILRSCDYGHFKECESGSIKPQGHREITWPNLVSPQFCIFYSWETRRLRPHLIVSPWKTSPANKTKANLCQQREPVLKYCTHVPPELCTVLCCAVLSCVWLFRPHSLPGSSVQGYSPGKNTGVGCHALLQGFFPIQGSNPGLPHCRRILSHLNHQGSTRILEWAA